MTQSHGNWDTYNNGAPREGEYALADKLLQTMQKLANTLASLPRQERPQHMSATTHYTHEQSHISLVCACEVYVMKHDRLRVCWTAHKLSEKKAPVQTVFVWCEAKGFHSRGFAMQSAEHYVAVRKLISLLTYRLTH